MKCLSESIPRQPDQPKHLHSICMKTKYLMVSVWHYFSYKCSIYVVEHLGVER